MNRCRIDHTQEDTVRKLSEQKAFLPKELGDSGEVFLSRTLDQDTLNEVFHLLKKYDLATEEEKLERNQKMKKLFVSSI